MIGRALFAAALAGIAGLGLGTAVQAQEVTLRAITSFPKPHLMNTPFHDLMAELNARAKGKVQIQYLGGPEVTPVQEQLGALSRGVVDVYYGPSSYFDGLVPEVMAQNASNKTAVELRAAGGHDLLSAAFQKKAGAHYLGYFGSGYTFHIYLKNQPKLAGGKLDLAGTKVRGATVYRPFYEKLGVNMVLVHVPEMHTALERGVVDGVGWTTLAVTDLGWDKFLKYRIFPTFWQGDIAFLVNDRKWNALSGEQRDILLAAVVDAEKKAHAFFLAEAAKQSDKLRASGMKDVTLEGTEATQYRSFAHETLWEQLGQKIAKEDVAKLRAAFYKE